VEQPGQRPGSQPRPSTVQTSTGEDAAPETVRRWIRVKALSAQIDRQLDAHADAHIFTSLPRSGRVRAARLLAEIGDCRARFPTPDSLTCLAGAAPSTRQSGKLRVVGFRWACDKQLRDAAVTNFAADSRPINPWAADLYDRARTRGHDHAHAHAVRVLARAWLHIIWHCWQDGVPYDPDQHRALQSVIAAQTAAGCSQLPPGWWSRAERSGVRRTRSALDDQAGDQTIYRREAATPRPGSGLNMNREIVLDRHGFSLAWRRRQSC